MRGRKCHSNGGSVETGPSRGAKDASDLSSDKPKTAPPVDYLADGVPPRRRFDRPGRRLGGRTGADASPLSTAGKTVSPPQPGQMASGGAAKNWIAGAMKDKGALHRSLGVPEGKKIPEAKLEKAEDSDNPKLAKRARLAETLKGFHK